MLLLLSLFSISTAQAATMVDLQFALCDPAPGHLAARLGFEKAPKPHAMTYFDTNDGQLARRGVFLKAKEKKQSFATEVKVIQGATGSPSKDCEVDRYGTKRDLKCSLEHESDSLTWTRAQKSFAESHGQIPWERLVAFGPYLEDRWKTDWEENNQFEAGLDLLHVPGHEGLAELSVKVPLELEEESYAQALRWLARHRVVLCPVQESKIFRLLRL